MKQTTIFWDNIISITDLREDIDSLNKCLTKYPYAAVFKNRFPLFIAVRPQWFREAILAEKETSQRSLSKRRKAASYFNKVARQAGDWQATKTVIKMREERKQKWTK